MEGSSAISEFRGEHEFLSNFFPSTVHLDGASYPTVEHAFQAAKTLDPDERERVRTCTWPGGAKRLGKRVALRIDWEEAKLGIMESLVREKFADPDLRQRLLATGSRELIEGNRWGDTYWGVCRGRGANHLGRILMKVRDELVRA